MVVSVFFPHYFDSETPIATIHREVAQRLNERFESTFFVTENQPTDERAPVRVIAIPAGAGLLTKGFRYGHAFSREWDIIHTGPSRRNLLAFVSSLRGSNIVHTLHATPDDSTVVRRQRWLSKQADVVTAVSPFVAEWAERTLGVRTEIRVIPNGIDPSKFTEETTSQNRDVVVFAGRLVEQKHPHFILNVAQELPELTFKMFGTGPQATHLRSNAPENLELHGQVPREKLIEELSRAAVTVCPYEREGFGLVCIESFASGTPVVGYASGNLPNLINTQNGVLCDELDVKGWVNTINSVRDNFKSFTPNETIERFRWENVAKEYEKLYSELQ